MDATGALSELGITVPTSAEAIRRAYLRSVRAHPTERDPEGFRRVRDAYELLKDAPWLWTTLSVREPDDDEADERDDEDSDVAVVRAETLAPTERDEGTAARAGDEPLEPPPAADAAEDENDEGEGEQEGERESPTEGFFEGDYADSPDPLEQAMSSGDFEGAAEVLLGALGAELGAGNVGEEARFAPWQVLEVALRLYVQGKFALGERLLASFDTWIERRRLLPSALGTVATARWALLKELRKLPGVVPAPVVKALAKSVEDGQFLSAASTLEWANAVDDDFEWSFKRHAPLLHQAASRYADVWRKPTAEKAGWRGVRDFPSWRYVFIAVALLQGVRLCTKTDSTRPRSDAPVIANFERAKTEGVASADEVFASLHARMGAEVDEALKKGDCGSIRDLWFTYSTASRSPRDDPAYQRIVDERRAAVLKMCPELEGVLR